MAVRVKEGRAQIQVNVGEMLDWLKAVMTEAVCDSVFQEQRTGQRRRTWTLYPLMWFWAMVSAKGVESVREGVREARAGWGDLVTKVKASRQALCKRAQELSWIFFMNVFHRVVDALAQDPTVKPRYCQDLEEETRKKWPRVLVVDASKLDPIARRLRILRNVKDQVLPGMVLAVYDLYLGIPRRLWFDPDAARSEHQLGIEWLDTHMQGGESEPEPLSLRDAPIVGDRLYGTLEFLAKTRQKGAWALVRRNRSVKIRGRPMLLSRRKVPGYGLILEDRQVRVGTGEAAQTLRLIKLIGGRRGTLEWFTNVLDAKRLTPWEAAEFYLRRWQVERMFATLKTVLDLKSFLLAHPSGVAHQVYGASLVYVAMRTLQGKIAAELSFHPEGLSTAKLFPRLRKALHAYLVATLTVHRVRVMNRGKRLRMPDPAKMDFCWIELEDALLETREGRGAPRRGKPNWKSFRHINGGGRWIEN